MSRLTLRTLMSLLAAAALLSACGEEEEESCSGSSSVTCQNGGSPSGSAGACTCACPAGYEGASCETARNAAFLGSYAAVDNCSRSAMSEYEVVITADGTNAAGVRISNFYNTFTRPVVATVDGQGRLVMTEQEPDADAFFVSGSATRNGNTLSVSYTVDLRDPIAPANDACTGTWTRRP